LVRGCQSKVCSQAQLVDKPGENHADQAAIVDRGPTSESE
jgi:hypothetical protein